MDLLLRTDLIPELGFIVLRHLTKCGPLTKEGLLCEAIPG